MVALTQESKSPVLELEQVSKRFGHVVALERVSMSVHSGEVLAIVGDNGAGKSTMFKVLAGVHEMDSGKYMIDGVSVSLNSPAQAHAHGIAAVFQNLALVECLDVATNMYLGHPLTKARFIVDKRRMVESAADTLRELRVRVPSVRVPVGILSGGQRQGVAIARAVQESSRIVLMDEPTAALGYRETRQVLAIIRELREHDAAVIVISHDLELVFDVADRILVMRLGRVAGVRNADIANRDEIIGLITGAIAGDSINQDGAV